MTAKIVTYNIRYGLGKDFKKDLTRIADSVRGADVIALQEIKRNWPDNFYDQPEEISKLLPEYFWVYGPSFDMDASQKDAKGNVQNRRRQFGTMLLSKEPIISSRLYTFPKSTSISHFNMDTGAIEGIINVNSNPIRFYSLHLSALAPRERMLQLNHFLSIHKRACSEGGGAWCGPSKIGETDWGLGEPEPPNSAEAIVMGDFNCDTTGPEYELMSEDYDPQQGRVTYTDSFVDSWVAAGNENEELITWQKDKYTSGQDVGRLDYIFLTPRLAKNITRSWVDNEAIGSDHQPYWVELDL